MSMCAVCYCVTWPGVPHLAVQHCSPKDSGRKNVFRVLLVELAKVYVDSVYPLSTSALHLSRM